MIYGYEEVVVFIATGRTDQIFDISIFEAFNKRCYSLVGCARQDGIKNRFILFKNPYTVVLSKVNDTLDFC